MFEEIQRHIVKYIYKTVRDECRPQDSEHDNPWEFNEELIYYELLDEFDEDLTKRLSQYIDDNMDVDGWSVAGYIEAVIDSVDVDQAVRDAISHYYE